MREGRGVNGREVAAGGEVEEEEMEADAAEGRLSWGNDARVPVVTST